MTVTEIPSDSPRGRSANLLVWLSLFVAGLGLAGSLWLSIGMGLKACPLCFYQRTFVMGVAAVLAVGVLTGERHRDVLSVLALPMAVAAFVIAAFHVYLELSGKLECPRGIMGLGTAPQQSLAILTVLMLSTSAGALRSVRTGESRLAVIVAAVVGLLLAVGAIASTPPMPGAPTKAYDAPPEICRPPHG